MHVRVEKKDVQGQKVMYSKELCIFYNMQERALIQSAMIKHALFSVHYFQVIFLKSAPLHLNSNVTG